MIKYSYYYRKGKGRMRGSRMVIGILAHVDAGKTTLAEGLLYICGQIRRLGRVDHKDAFLDSFSLERERGITIFSKQAQISYQDMEITLLDTPGHVDFSAEMERTLQVLDYCILVISGSDGVQGHVQTLWRLLKQYGIPTFLFVNKMDQPGTDRGQLMKELQAKLGGECVEVPEGLVRGRVETSENPGGKYAEMPELPGTPELEAFYEELSMCDEGLMEEYLESGSLTEESIAMAVRQRRVFLCFFGAALHLQGVEELLCGIRRFSRPREYPEEFGARVYKISRDSSGSRLTHLKVTGGRLRVKMPVGNRASALSESEVWEEKADQLRIYSGAQFTPADEVTAGGICAVTGLSRTFVGQGLGMEGENAQPLLEPVLTYRLLLPEGSDPVRVLGQLRVLEEEEPLLHVVWREAAREIHVQVMGDVQIEILKRLLSERFGLEAEFADGSILYKETIASPVIGIGHFEPLRHYAEVHLLLEPGEPGSGLKFDSRCSEDVLDKNWQRLIFTHMEEKTHLGVLTGSPVTDLKITLLTGRAHLKHTEGGDFRQATYRALRQGLMQGESVLLEPVFAFCLEVPLENLGRAMSDVQRMSGSFQAPVTEGEYAVLTGTAPAVEMQGYQRELSAYSKGLGRLACNLKGYEPCHNAEEVIAEIDYQAEADLENPSSSVFCAHGAGFVVSWDKVAEYAHLESDWESLTEDEFSEDVNREGRDGLPEAVSRHGSISSLAVRNNSGSGRSDRSGSPSQTGSGASDYITQEEIEEIFQRTYGKTGKDYAPYRYHQRNTGREVRAWDSDADRGTGVAAEREAGTNSEQGAAARVRGEAEKEADITSGKKTAAKAGIKPEKREEYLLVDGYNIIFAWEELRELAKVNIDSARDRLVDICSNYQGSRGCTLILVFDAYKVRGNPGSVLKHHNIYVVYTREAETADQYIEKTVHEMGRKHQVTVATSDGLEQMIIWGEGASRLSAAGFYEAVEDARRQTRELISERTGLKASLKLPEIQ